MTEEDNINNEISDLSFSNDKNKSGDFDTLVLSGGSIHAIIMLGALQYAEDNYLLKKIDKYIGTSAGAMCGYLLAIGYTPEEIIVFLCTKQLLERMKNFNVVAMMNGNGATTFNYIHEQLEKMTIEKIGQLITLGDLYDKYGKTFICTTFNRTTNTQEILSHETYPDMPCLIAIRMSSNLPFIFDKFKYMNNYYTDGGIYDNFPINIGNDKGNKVLGLVLYNTPISFTDDKPMNIIENIYQLLSISSKQNMLKNIDSVSEKCLIVKIQPDNTPFFNFNLDTYTKLEMFSNGYKQMRDKLEC